MFAIVKTLLGKVPAEDWLLIALVAVSAVMFIRIRVLEAENRIDVSNLQVAKASLQTAVTANSVNVETIKALETANDSFRLAADKSATAMTSAVDRLAGISNELDKNASDISAKSAAILAEPTCDKLAHADIATLCPDLSKLMRDGADRQRNFFSTGINGDSRAH